MSQKFTPSPYQTAVYDAVKTGTDSLIINAVAGSGKTTTIVESLKYINPSKKVLFAAFNKSIATELQNRVPKHVKASTWHSYWFGVLRNHLRDRGINAQVESNKVRNLVRDFLGERDRIAYGAFITRMVGLAKSAGVGYLLPDTAGTWFDLMDHFDIYLDTKDDSITETRGIELAQMILKENNRQEDVVDFDDMLYLSLILNLRGWQYDFVFIDEAQDTNQMQIALLKRMVRAGGVVVAVGDPHQAIYGFRGADSEAMNRISEEFGCRSLPLTVSYRCPQAVVREAQKFVPEIEAFDGAAEGKVEGLPEVDIFSLRAGDAILCRVTAPLVETAYGLIRRKVSCKIMGRDIGVGLENLIKQMKAMDLDHLEERLDAYLSRETAKLVSKGREDKAQAVDDKVRTLKVIIDHLEEDSRTLNHLVAAIQSLFTDNGKGMLTLSTVHKAKGLEWPRVFILARDRHMPSKWARKPWQKQQEVNLIYVAYTRAKAELYFIDEGFYKAPRKEAKS